MHLWPLCHLAMVVRIADAYVLADNPSEAGRERKLMRRTAEQLKTNFRRLKKARGKLSPAKMNLFLLLPVPVLTIALSLVFESAFGNKFMYRHAVKAPDEMRRLHEQFYAYLEAEA